MIRLQSLKETANGSYERGQYRAAYLGYLEVVSSARTIGDYAEVVNGLVNAHQSAERAGLSPALCFQLLMDARLSMHEHPEALVDPQARPAIALQLVEHALEYTPDKSLLLERLHEVSGLDATDDAYVRSRFHDLLGEWNEAASFAERSWTTYRSGSSRNHRPVYGLRAFHAALSLGAIDQAADWLTAVKDTFRARPCPNCERNYLSATVEYTLARHSDIETSRQALISMQAQEQLLDMLPKLSLVSVRVWLKDPQLGDPQESAHPASRMLSRRYTENNRSLTALYVRTLAHFDFRLASLRYSLGQPPHDYDRTAQGEPPPAIAQRTRPKLSSRQNIAARVTKTLASWRAAHKLAADLDSALCCRWRTDDVARRERDMTTLLALV